MTTRTLSVLLSLGLLLAACGDTESILIVDAADDVVPGDGHSTTEVTAQAIFQGNPVRDGTRINLTASGGSFKDGQEALTLQVSTSGGKATATWYAPVEQGEYEIDASYEDPYKQPQQAQATVVVGPPTPIDGNTFTFSCAASNIGAPRSGEPDVRVPCSVTATDVNGKAVAVDLNRFGFMAEAGTFKIDKGQLYWDIAANQFPKDVDPEGGASDGEPRWTDQAAGNKVRNPRDGIVALAVHTLGRPAAQDMMQGEPYLDENDDGQWNPDEPFFDADGNQSWTGPQVGVSETEIWRWTRLLLTFEVSPDAPTNAAVDGLALWDPASVEIPAGGSKTVSLVLVDMNLNPAASHPAGAVVDYVEYMLDNSHAVVTPSRVNLERDRMGLTFNQSTGALDGRAVLQTYLNQIPTYTFSIANHISTNATVDESFGSKSVNIRRTPRPGGQQISESLPVNTAPTGTLKAPQ